MLPWLRLQPPSCETQKQISLQAILCLIDAPLVIDSTDKGTMAYV